MNLKKIILLVGAILFFGWDVKGQNVNAAYSYDNQSSGSDLRAAIELDGKKTLILDVTRDSMDIDFGPQIKKVVSSKLNRATPFLAVYDSILGYITSKVFLGGGTIVRPTLRYHGGNIYLFCSVYDSLDFDFSGSNTYSLASSNNYSRAFMVKYDGQFNLKWVKVLKGTGTPSIYSANISPSGEILIGGVYTGTIDFDPSANVVNKTTAGSRTSDMFFAKFDTSGTFKYVKQLKGAYNATVSSPRAFLLPDSSIYFSALGSKIFDLDPGTGVQNSTADRSFFAHYDKQGNYLAKLPTSGKFVVKDGVFDDNGNGYIVGNVGTNTLPRFDVSKPIASRVYYPGLFLVKIDSVFNFSWLRAISPAKISAPAVSQATRVVWHSQTKKVYMTGGFSGNVKFEGGKDTIAINNLFKNSQRYGYFISRYDINGNIDMCKGSITDTTAGYAVASDLIVFDNEDMFLHGNFQYRHDFDPSPISKILRTSSSRGNLSSFFLLFGKNLSPTLSSIRDTAICSSVDTLKVNYTLLDDKDTNATIIWSTSDTNVVALNSIISGGTGSSRSIGVLIGDSINGSCILQAVVFDSDSLSDTTSFKLSISKPTIDSMSITHPACNGDSTGSIKIYASGFGPLTYSIDSILFNSSSTISKLSTSIYRVWGKDSLNCLTNDSATLLNPDPLLVSLKASVNPLCNKDSNGVVELKGSGGVGKLQFRIGSSSFSNDSTFKNLPSGSYTALVMDTNGCVDSFTSITLADPAKLSLDSTLKIDVVCHGNSTGAVYAFASGGTGSISYKLNAGNYSGSRQFTALKSGSYQVFIRDANQCMDSSNVVHLNQPATIVPSYTIVNHITCFNGADGALVTRATGGLKPYRYSTNGINYQPAAGFTGLHPGPTTLYVKDSVGCVKSTVATLTQPPKILVVFSKQKDISCFGLNDGEAVASVTGGTGRFLYSIAGGPYTTKTIYTGLAKGSHYINVEDSSKCRATGPPAVINSPDTLLITTVVTDETLGNDGEIDVNVTGGTGPFEYSLDGTNYGTNKLLDKLKAGTYAVFVKDANSCIGSIEVTVKSTVGYSEHSRFGFNFYPNPTSGRVNLKFDVGVAYVSLKVTNISGQVLSVEDYENLSLISTTITGAPGVYFLELSFPNGETETIRILKY